jgi:hypothetical protein
MTGLWQVSHFWPKTACEEEMGPEENAAALREAEMPIQAMAATMATSASLNCQVRMGEPFLK